MDNKNKSCYDGCFRVDRDGAFIPAGNVMADAYGDEFDLASVFDHVDHHA